MCMRWHAPGRCRGAAIGHTVHSEQSAMDHYALRLWRKCRSRAKKRLIHRVSSVRLLSSLCKRAIRIAMGQPPLFEVGASPGVAMHRDDCSPLVRNIERHDFFKTTQCDRSMAVCSHARSSVYALRIPGALFRWLIEQREVLINSFAGVEVCDETCTSPGISI